MKNLHKEAQRVAKHVFNNMKLTYKRDPGVDDYNAVIAHNISLIVENKKRFKGHANIKNIKGLKHPL